MMAVLIGVLAVVVFVAWICLSMAEGMNKLLARWAMPWCRGSSASSSRRSPCSSSSMASGGAPRLTSAAEDHLSHDAVGQQGEEPCPGPARRHTQHPQAMTPHVAGAAGMDRMGEGHERRHRQEMDGAEGPIVLLPWIQNEETAVMVISTTQAQPTQRCHAPLLRRPSWTTVRGISDKAAMA